MQEKKIIDKDLGTIILRWGRRYTRLTLKISRGTLIATMPSPRNESTMIDLIEKNREKLITALQQQPAPQIINESTNLQTASFRLLIAREKRKNVAVALRNEILTITFPDFVDFDNSLIQQQIRDILKNVLRHEAKRLLPQRLSLLATKHGFSFSGVKITSSLTRWGSCNSRQSINLSLHLMQLPWHLIDYVILHELCHTREMNHSPRFWALMDSVTDGQAKALRQELKKFEKLY
ncbi:M48 family metallopeptidase [Parabacteroides sp. OttesenSCG-928-K15]|nr:M48 family metallopeptidase [Parabacteroides sp. OttesenSCG-928-K15]